MSGSGGRATLAVAPHSCWVVVLLVMWPGQARGGPAAADVSWPQHLLLLLLEEDAAASEPMHGGWLLLLVLLVVLWVLGLAAVALAAVAGKESEMRMPDFLCAVEKVNCMMNATYCVLIGHTRSN